MLSRPDLDEELAFYWEAFCFLARDRTVMPITVGGLTGSCLLLPARIPREAMRRYGRRDLHLTNEELEDFVAILVGIDDYWVEQERARQVAEAVRAAKRAEARAKARR